VTFRRHLAIAALAAVLLLTGSCGTTSAPGSAGPVQVAKPDGDTGDSASLSDGTLLVGLVASLTGSGETYGTSQADGTNLALELEGASTEFPLTVSSLDDASDPDTGASAFESLIERGASVIMGPTLSPVASTADPLAQAVGVPVLAVTNTTLDIKAIGDAVWRVTLSERAMLPQSLATARDLRGVQTAVLLYDESDTYATGAATAFRTAASKTGVKLLDDVAFSPASLEPAGYQSLLRAAVGAKPDAILLAARARPAVDLLLAIKQLRLTETILGSNGFNPTEVLAEAGDAANGLIVTASWNAGIDDRASRTFVEQFRLKHQRDPDTFAAQSYAGVQVLIAAARAGGGTSRRAISRGLAALGEVDTVLGTLRFVDNEAVYPASVQVVTDGRFELLTQGTP
jgi:branched-chain amino acid transport system substrate-binding protein